MQILISKKVFLIAAGIAFILLITTVFINSQIGKTTSNTLYRPAITATAPIASVEVGKTSGQTVQQLPGVSQPTHAANGLSTYEISHNTKIPPDLVAVKNNVVTFEQITLPGQIQTQGYSNLKDYVTNIGNPEAIYYGSKTYGANFLVYFYGKNGFAVVANMNTGEVYMLQLFPPMTAANYLSQYGQDIMSTTGPLPVSPE